MEIIDCHTHIGTDYFWQRSGVMPHSHTLTELLQKMDAHGVHKAVAFPMASSPYFAYEGLLRGEHVPSGSESFPYERAHRALIEQRSERIIPFFCFNPQAKISEQLAFLEEQFDAGVLRGLKYHPFSSGAAITDSRCSAFLEFANERRLPLILHYGLDRHSNSGDLLACVAKYDHMRFSLAHAARFDDHILSHLNELPNLFMDVACLSGECALAQNFTLTDVYDGFKRRAYPFDTPRDVLTLLADEFPDSVLWGTDEPFTSLNDGETQYYGSSFGDEVRLLRTIPGAERIASRNPRAFLQHLLREE